jgi:hypothetical protein
MTQINFGVGTAIGRRTGVSNPKPSFMGVLQDIEIDFDQTLKELRGQYKLPVDVAPAELKITGKAKFATIQANTINDLLLGQTLTAASGIDMATAESATVPASSPYNVTVANSATWIADFGVFYASTGIQLIPVAAGSEATGKYSVLNGVYKFASGDASVVLNFYYSYSVTTLNKISMANTLMGTGPVFELFLSESYTNNLGVMNKLNLKLNACRSSKLALPFKNVDYTIQELDFQAFADQAGNWGTLATTE